MDKTVSLAKAVIRMEGENKNIFVRCLGNEED